jgi:hypothetical protein
MPSEDETKRANYQINQLYEKYPESSDPTYQQKLNLINEGLRNNENDEVLKIQSTHFNNIVDTANRGISTLLLNYPASSDPSYEKKIKSINDSIEKTNDLFSNRVLKYQLNYFKEQIIKANNAIDVLTYDYPASSDPIYDKKIEIIKYKISANPDDSLLKYQLNYFETLKKDQKTTVSADDAKNNAMKTKDKLLSEIKAIKKEFDDFWKNSNIFEAIIKLDIDKLNTFAVSIFNIIKNISSKIGDYLYNFVESTLTTYSLMITMIFFILFVAILLFAKDKFGNILVLFYFYTGFLITGFFVTCIKWIGILYNKAKKLFTLIYTFLKLLLQEAPLSLEDYWIMIKTVFWIIVTIIGICFTLIIFCFTAIGIEFLIRLANVLFITIDENNEDSTLDFMEIIGKIYSILKGTLNSVNGDGD